MPVEDTINRVFREFRRYTGDGLPGEPLNALLPVGDPQSGVHSPKKAEIRAALLAPLTSAQAEADRAKEEADRAEAAAGASGEGVAIVSTRAAMASLNPSAKSVAYLKEGKRSGMFIWDSSDCSADVANDTQQGAVVARSTDATGASGAWRRIIGTYADVKWWGARGDGTDVAATCTTAFRETAWYCGKYGVDYVISDAIVDYPISGKIQLKVTRDLTVTDQTPASDVHFTDNLPYRVKGVGNARVRATAAMTAIFELIFDTADGDIGPFYSSIENLHLDGGGLATAGVRCDYTMHVSITKCRFDRLTAGISYNGYGVFTAEGNVFRCVSGISLIGGGGDSVIAANDFYFPSEGSVGIRFGYTSGNCRVFSNVFTDENNLTTSYGVLLAGGSAPASEEIRDIFIEGNEFCGLTAGVRADGKSSVNKNVWRNTIRDNHTSAFGSKNTGCLIQAADCLEFDISDNRCNTSKLGDGTSVGIDLARCETFSVRDNRLMNYASSAIQMTDCTDTIIEGNYVKDAGKLGSGYTVVVLFGAASARNVITGNVLRRTSTSYGGLGIYEQPGVTGTVANDNHFFGFETGTPQRRDSINSTMRIQFFADAIPTTGSYQQGDIVWRKSTVAGGSMGWVCVVGGVPGTWKTFGAIAA